MDNDLKTQYMFKADNMFAESDLYFKFVIRECIRHQKELDTKTIQKILREESERLDSVERF